MAIFSTGQAYQSNSVGTASTVVVFSGTAASLAAISPAVTLRDVTILNSGSQPVYLGSSSVTAATGLKLGPGQQMTIQGWTETSNTTTNDIYAIGAVATGGSVVEASLATLASVV